MSSKLQNICSTIAKKGRFVQQVFSKAPLRYQKQSGSE